MSGSSYHTRRVFSPEEFSFAIEMLDTYPWISRPLHRRGFDEMMDRLIISPDERDLLRILLGKFSYVDVDETETYIQSIIDHLDAWGCTDKNTVFVATREKPGDNDGSYVFLKQLQDRLYGWDEKRFQNIYDYRHRFRTLKNYDKIILVDDFIGSGFTIDQRYHLLVSELAKSSKHRDVYVIAFAGMADSKANYPFLSGGNVYLPLWLEKAFDRKTAVHETQVMDDILNRLNNRNNDSKHCRLKDFGYGFGDMAGVYFNVHYRMSDNMLAIFWWGLFKENRDEYHSMFRRS